MRKKLILEFNNDNYHKDSILNITSSNLYNKNTGQFIYITATLLKDKLPTIKEKEKYIYIYHPGNNKESMYLIKLWGVWWVLLQLLVGV